MKHWKRNPLSLCSFREGQGELPKRLGDRKRRGLFPLPSHGGAAQATPWSRRWGGRHRGTPSRALLVLGWLAHWGWLVDTHQDRERSWPSVEYQIYRRQRMLCKDEYSFVTAGRNTPMALKGFLNTQQAAPHWNYRAIEFWTKLLF